jgi:hypothetical protein
MSGRKADATGLVIGGEPRIDFLPPEVKASKEAKRTRRSMTALVLIVVAACAAGFVFSATLAGQAQGELSAAQERTQALIQEQGEYNEVRMITGQLAASANARLVGSANEIMWATYMARLVASLPAGATITKYSVEAPSFNEGVSIPDNPLRGASVATVRFVASFPSIAAAKNALKNLESLDGYAGAWVTPISRDDDGTYLADFTLAVNTDVLERRFFEAVEEPEDEGTDAVATDAEEPEAAEDETEPADDQSTDGGE